MYAASLSPAFAVRLAVEADRKYILGTWRESEKDTQARTERHLYQPMQSGAMEAILTRASTSIRVAHPIGSEDTIAAWAVVRAPVPVLHKGPGLTPHIGPTPIVYYAYVRIDGRRLGVASMLLLDFRNRSRVLFTSLPSRPKGGDHVTIPPHWQYCPRAAFIEAP